MAKDPYQTLGVNRSATAEEIKRAFREAAKKYHPDKTKGDKTAELKFKEINSAYDILGDTDKRKKFDRGEIDGAGNPTGYGAGFAGAGAGAGSAGGRTRSGSATNEDFGFGGFSAEDLFADLFGGSRRGKAAGGGGFEQHLKGEDIKYDLNITLFEAVRGAKRRVTLANGKTFDVTVPAATTDGQTLRLKGLGEAGRGGPAGDALITMRVEPNPLFTMKGLNLYTEVVIGLHEAVLGAEIPVPTLDGIANVKVPKGSNTGTQLRLKGKGAANKQGQIGDQYVTLRVMLPEKHDDDLVALVEKWAKKHAYNPRKK